MLTRFIELGAPDAEQTLRRLRDGLEQAPGVVRTDLLESLEEPGLYLLVLECEGSEPPTARWPEGSRVWSFRRVDG